MRVGFIGAGSLAQAVIRGLLGHCEGSCRPTDIAVTDRSSTRAPQCAEELGVTYCPDLKDLVECSEVLIVAVKPQALADALKQLSPLIDGSRLVISVAAGKSLEYLQKRLPDGTAVLRVMPNVNAAVGLSMTGIARGSHATDDDVVRAESIFNCVGATQVISELDFPVFSALAGCAPAWLFQVVEALARAGVKGGLPKDQAVTIVAQTMAGSAALLLQSGVEGGCPSVLIDRVASPAGTTIAGLLAAESAGLSNSLVAAVEAAVQRDGELQSTD